MGIVLDFNTKVKRPVHALTKAEMFKETEEKNKKERNEITLALFKKKGNK